MLSEQLLRLRNVRTASILILLQELLELVRRLLIVSLKEAFLEGRALHGSEHLIGVQSLVLQVGKSLLLLKV